MRLPCSKVWNLCSKVSNLCSKVWNIDFSQESEQFHIEPKTICIVLK